MAKETGIEKYKKAKLAEARKGLNYQDPFAQKSCANCGQSLQDFEKFVNDYGEVRCSYCATDDFYPIDLKENHNRKSVKNIKEACNCKLEDFEDWLADHKQATEDFKKFCKNPKKPTTAEMEDWLADHEQANKDFNAFRKNWSSCKNGKCTCKESKRQIKEGFYTDEEREARGIHPQDGGGICNHCGSDVAGGDFYDISLDSTREIIVAAMVKEFNGPDYLGYEEREAQNWFGWDDDTWEEQISNIYNYMADDSDYLCHDCMYAEVDKAVKQWHKEWFDEEDEDLEESKKSKANLKEDYSDEDLDMDEDEWLEKMKAERNAQIKARQEKRDAEAKAQAERDRIARGDLTPEEKAAKCKKNKAHNWELLADYVADKCQQDCLEDFVKEMAGPVAKYLEFGNPFGFNPEYRYSHCEAIPLIPVAISGVKVYPAEEGEELTDDDYRYMFNSDFDFYDGNLTYYPVYEEDSLNMDMTAEESEADDFHSGVRNKEAWKKYMIDGEDALEDIEDIHDTFDMDAELFACLQWKVYEQLSTVIVAACIQATKTIGEAKKLFKETPYRSKFGDHGDFLFYECNEMFFSPEVQEKLRNGGLDESKKNRKRSIKESYDDTTMDFSMVDAQLNQILHGGWEGIYGEDWEADIDPYKAQAIHQKAQSKGLSDIDYIEREEDLDSLIDEDAEDIAYLVEYNAPKEIMDYTVNSSEDLQRIYNDMKAEAEAGKRHGYWGSLLDTDDKIMEALLEDFEMCIDDACAIGNSTNMDKMLERLYIYKDDPRCKKVIGPFYDWMCQWAKNYNDLCDSLMVGSPRIKFPEDDK